MPLCIEDRCVVSILPPINLHVVFDLQTLSCDVVAQNSSVSVPHRYMNRLHAGGKHRDASRTHKVSDEHIGAKGSHMVAHRWPSASGVVEI